MIAELSFVAIMLLAGILLSAFFSGVETGFYRATRVRMVLDARSGSRVARSLLWLTNNPAVFVATTLIGNNLANYITSAAIVLAAGLLFSGDALWVGVVAPVALAPVLFVYGELLPKYLFFRAPNRLLRLAGPPFLLFGVLFAPLAALLWAMARLLQGLLGKAPERVRLALARAELAKVLEEGHEAGILSPAQQHLAQALFAVANEPVTRFATAVPRMVAVRVGTLKSDVLQLAQRHGIAAVPVEEVTGRRRELVGYVRTVDLCLAESDVLDTYRPLIEIPQSETHIAAMMRMQSEQEMLARVVDEKGETVGLLDARNLTQPLFRGE